MALQGLDPCGLANGSGGEFRRFFVLGKACMIDAHVYLEKGDCTTEMSTKRMKNIHDTLSLHLEEDQYRDMIAQYHFAEEDLEQLERIGKFAEEVSVSEMYCGMMVNENRLAVIVTLGSGFDVLQEQYMQRERLLEGYMLECIGMELLRKAYEQTAEHIYAHTGMWISGFDFLGEREPFSRMEEIFRQIQPQGIECNQAYMLMPKKTVVFLTDLCEQRKDSYCHVCADCGNVNCLNRKLEEIACKVADPEMRVVERPEPGMQTVERQRLEIEPQEGRKLTYGYRRIFGELSD